MTGYDLTEAVNAAVQALRAAGLADNDGAGYVLENVYADGAVHVALTSALPHLEQQIREQVAQDIEAMANPLATGFARKIMRHAARIARTRKDTDHA